MFLVLLNCELEEEDCVESIWTADGMMPCQFVSPSVGGVSSGCRLWRICIDAGLVEKKMTHAEQRCSRTKNKKIH